MNFDEWLMSDDGVSEKLVSNLGLADWYTPNNTQ